MKTRTTFRTPKFAFGRLIIAFILIGTGLGVLQILIVGAIVTYSEIEREVAEPYVMGGTICVVIPTSLALIRYMTGKGKWRWFLKKNC